MNKHEAQMIRGTAQEDLSRITKQRNQYRSICEFVASGDCPEHSNDINCVKDSMDCQTCLMDYVRKEMEGVEE